jgi:hypothetical protein
MLWMLTIFDRFKRQLVVGKKRANQKFPEENLAKNLITVGHDPEIYTETVPEPDAFQSQIRFRTFFKNHIRNRSNIVRICNIKASIQRSSAES